MVGIGNVSVPEDNMKCGRHNADSSMQGLMK